MIGTLPSLVTASVLLAPAGGASLWSPQDSPAIGDYGDGQAVELGVEFRSDVDVRVTGVRFYKSEANTGPHVVSLWARDGRLLARSRTTVESPRGWQEAPLDPPVAIQPGVAYVASYHVPAGRYPADPRYFSDAGRDAVPLHAPATSGGRFAYGPAPAFPAESFAGTNYWVDVTVTRATPPPAVGAVGAAALRSAAPLITPLAPPAT